jgi:hypothetical protein
MKNPNLAIFSANDFIVSAAPYVTASTLSSATSFTFSNGTDSYLSSFVTVKNTSVSSSIRVGFTSAGIVGSNFFTVSAGTSYTAPWALKTIFLSGAAATPFELIAGLARVRADTISDISSSNGYLGVNP